MTSVVKPGYVLVDCFTSDSFNPPSYWAFYPYNGENRQGDDDPSWQSKVRQRIDATNNYVAERTEVQFLPGQLTYKQIVPKEVLRIYPWAGYLNGWNIISRGLIQASWYPDSSFTDLTFGDTAYNLAIGRFNEAALGHMHPVRGAFWAELKDTMGMLRGATKKLFLSVTDLQKKVNAFRNSGLRGRKLVKASSNAWLEYSFGWKPAFSDIESICKKLVTDKFRQRQFLVTGFGKEEAKYLVPWTVKFKESGGTGYHMNERIHSCLIKGILDLDLVDNATENWSSPTLSGWGASLSEVVPALWEATAYSFLVDYFTNISDILQAAFVERRFFRFVNMVKKWEAVDQWALNKQVNMHDPYNNLTMEVNEHLNPMLLRIHRKKMQRFKDPILSLPSLELSYPSFGSLKWLNMTALLTSRVNTR